MWPWPFTFRTHFLVRLATFVLILVLIAQSVFPLQQGCTDRQAHTHSRVTTRLRVRSGFMCNCMQQLHMKPRHYVHDELFIPHRVDRVANDVRHEVLWRLIHTQHTVRVAVRPWNGPAVDCTTTTTTTIQQRLVTYIQVVRAAWNSSLLFHLCSVCMVFIVTELVNVLVCRYWPTTVLF